MTTKKILEEKRTDLYKVDINAIQADFSTNVREDYGNLEELAQDILLNGVKEPLRGNRDKDDTKKFILTHGFRRYKACMLLIQRGDVEEMRVPFINNPRGFSEVDTIMEHYSLNNTGKPLTMLEMSGMVKKLNSLGLTEEEIAAKFGKSITFVKNCLLLMEAPEWVKNMIRNDRIAPSLVLDIFKKEDNFDGAVGLIKKLDNKVGISESDSSAPEKITASDVEEIKGRVNSVGIFKKIAKANHNKLVRQDKVEMYEFAKRLIAGEYTQEQLEEMFFV